MTNIKFLSELQLADAPLAGGKAFRCAQMRQAGLPVPDGFVLLAGSAQAANAIVELRDHLLRWPPSSRFAVRSSAIDEDGTQHSFAGMHETLLNVAPDDVAHAVRDISTIRRAWAKEAGTTC